MSLGYFKCIGGVSGDMILGSIIDSGISLNQINEGLSLLNIEGYQIDSHLSNRGGVTGTRFEVNYDSNLPNRNFKDFIDIVNNSSLPNEVKKDSCLVFNRLIEAEKIAHKSESYHMELHELGEIDTLIDVVGSVFGFYILKLDAIYLSSLPAGSGLIKIKHGIVPVPSPATAALLSLCQIPLRNSHSDSDNSGEMITPTGVAILTTLGDFKQPQMYLDKISYGLGKRESDDYPNVLSLWIGDEVINDKNSNLVLLETNIDDTNGEILGYVYECLLNMGVNDIWYVPISMKKNRPGVMLSVIVSVKIEQKVIDFILNETSTLGIRVRNIIRYEAKRQIRKISTNYGEVNVKIKIRNNKIINISPEYEHCKKIAIEQNLTLKAVMDEVLLNAQKELL
ncbi:MAG: TIGR00299 family protein [Chloroflexi bacterium]|nr:TIGR00299 family protein [Chloroflexota bacterium]